MQFGYVTISLCGMLLQHYFTLTTHLLARVCNTSNVCKLKKKNKQTSKAASLK